MNRSTPEAFRAIEERFAQALGFAEHQRHCGVHKNTSNLHLHIAYNQIHPESHNRHEPFRDYKTLSDTCRALEREYGLVVDNGMENIVQEQGKIVFRQVIEIQREKEKDVGWSR